MRESPPDKGAAGFDGAGDLRILLVEFITTDRFHCALYFPHALGWLDSLGAKTRWLRFGVSAAVRMIRGEQGVGLEESDSAALLAAVREYRPTHVLFSHYPAPATEGVLCEGEGSTPLAAVFGSTAGPADSAEGAPGALPVLAELDDLGRWLRLAPSSGSRRSSPELIDLRSPPTALPFLPAWRFEPANESARSMQPFVFVLAGIECSHMGSLGDNPTFADLVAGGVVPPRFGCTFCRRPVPDKAPGSSGMAPIDWACRQLEAVAATHPRSPTGELSLRIVGERIMRRVDLFAERVGQIDLAPAEFLFDARADTLAQSRARLERAAEAFEKAGHRMEMCLIGVENFSQRELERFNKGFGPEVNLTAVRILRELERRHPGVFGFRRYGGLSTILFTPWTTLEDLALNLAVIVHFDLTRLCGKALTSRVRLYEDLPLAARARRDGLLLLSYDDPALDTARRNFYESELPWRFVDPRADRLNRLTTRLQRDPSLAGEPLYEEIQAVRARLGEGEFDLALRFCRTIAGHPCEEDLSALLALAEEAPSTHLDPALGPLGVTDAARLTAESDIDEPDSPPSRARGQAEDSLDCKDPFLGTSVDWYGFKAGLKPVCRLEPLSKEELERVAPIIERVRPDAVQCARRRDWNEVESYELFVGREAQDVDELIEILAAREKGVPGELDRRYVRRVGVLLGYPACCSKRFAAAPEIGWLQNEWLHLENRIATPGPVATSIRPFGGPLSYVPCSAVCAQSIADEALLRSHGLEMGDNRTADWPMLFLLDRPAHFAVLRPLEPVGERFAYRLHRLFGQDARLAALSYGDTLELLPGQIRVLRTAGDTDEERVITAFSLDAYLWWHERAFHPEFWRQVVRRKLDPVVAPVEQGAPVEEQGGERAGGRASHSSAGREPAEQVVHAPPPPPPVDKQTAQEASEVPRLDLLLAWLRRLLRERGLPCRSLLPTADGELDLWFEDGARLLGVRWLNSDAACGEGTLLWAPVVPLGGTPLEAVAELTPRIQEAVLPAWIGGLRERLDRGNREHTLLDPAGGVRFLLRRRIAVGRPLWGAYGLASWDERLDDEGHPHSRLLISAGDRVVEVVFERAAARAVEPFFSSGLGVLRVLTDGRPPAARRQVAHQVERCLGFHFARAIPKEARWS